MLLVNITFYMLVKTNPVPLTYKTGVQATTLKYQFLKLFTHNKLLNFFTEQN